ncbi:ATP-binding cassette subfamily C protein CydD [Microbacterium testaceum]|uniref:ABC transporter ATP-binding protein/permease n=1 Tax=Microbacterium TaxID=33882 RepID=UPI002789E0FD|nr:MULTISPECIES: ATP-binding cassette domain-containing protein [Microbacterium]MDQ1111531.1 ATP-binding cassette subfamily C protein CydD [Microbacterium testaceum]MDR6097934.1 ATP-binding cassette subfamily C protein CydD [Microbacterium sp. SORGH_AS_0454]
MMIVPALWREAWRRPRLLAASVLLQLLVFATYVAQAVSLAVALSALVRADAGRALLGIGVILGLGVARLLLGLAQRDAAVRLGGCVREALRARAVSAVLAPERLHDISLRDGSTRLTLGDGIDGTEAYVSKYIPAVAQLAVGGIGVVIVLATLSPALAAGIALALVLAVLGPMAWKKMLARRGFTHWDTYEALSGDLLEALRGMSTLRALGDVPATRERLHTRSEALRRATERVMRSSLAETAITDLAIQAGTVLAAGVAIVDVLTGRAPATEVYVLLLLSSEAFRPVRELSRHWHAGFLGLTAVPGLRTLGAFAETGSSERRHPASDSPADAAGAAIVISDVTYRYPGAESPVLNGVSLRAERGAVHAIIGPSGAGKSTLFDLVLGFLPADRGSVELDGRPLRPEDVAVVSQRPVLFAATIRENIDLFGAAEGELERACADAGILAEIRALPGGFDTPVAEAGASLSGGQRQRLALARALLARRPVLLVDEPTSALDDANAELVAETLERVATDRIVLMISHRPEALRRVAHVHVLEGGVLVEAAS